ncbi:MAG: lipocalin-like domain-containing protein [Gemmatimonadota bacterium]
MTCWVAVAMTLACTPPAPLPVTGTARDSLLGTWRIVRYAVASADSTGDAFPIGNRPMGYLVYDATGHVFFQALRRSAMDSLRTGASRNAPKAQLYDLTNGFTAYFGTFVVDSIDHTVRHRIEGELPPRSSTMERANYFRISNDSLLLGTDSLRAWRFVRVGPPFSAGAPAAR